MQLVHKAWSGDYEVNSKLLGYPNITDTNSFKVYGSVYLKQGDEVPLIINYNELTGASQLALYWIRPDGVKEIVPSNALFH